MGVVGVILVMLEEVVVDWHFLNLVNLDEVLHVFRSWVPSLCHPDMYDLFWDRTGSKYSCGWSSWHLFCFLIFVVKCFAHSKTDTSNAARQSCRKCFSRSGLSFLEMQCLNIFRAHWITSACIALFVFYERWCLLCPLISLFALVINKVCSRCRASVWKMINAYFFSQLKKQRNPVILIFVCHTWEGLGFLVINVLPIRLLPKYKPYRRGCK